MIDWSGPRRQSCPSCGRGERDRTLGVTVEGWHGVAHCFRCGHVETIRDQHQHPSRRSPPTTPTATKRQALDGLGLALWESCCELSGAALDYLKARCCCIPPADGDLRCHPALRHPSGYIGPALVGLVTHAITGQPMTLHRTWVCADGRKANVTPPRLLLKGHTKKGGVIRLWPDEAVTSGLAIGEGIETTMSVAHAYQPAWACIDAGNLADMPVLRGVETVLVIADNDHSGAGQAAARSCAQRWADAGREVHIFTPTTPGRDANDELMGVAA